MLGFNHTERYPYTRTLSGFARTHGQSSGAMAGIGPRSELNSVSLIQKGGEIEPTFVVQGVMDVSKVVVKGCV